MKEETFEQPEVPQIDMLFVVDKSSSMREEIENITRSFGSFSAYLNEADVDFRIAFIVNDDGEMQGDFPYIDQSNADDAFEIIQIMMAGNGGLLTEQPLDLLASALPENEYWFRYGIDLHLVGITDAWQTESSLDMGGPEVYVNEFQSYTSGSAEVFFHGIGGDLPSGCDNAAPFDKAMDVVTATGGLFISICTDDWSATLTSLAEETVSHLLGFGLEEEAVPGSIEVLVDGDPSTTWTYDAEGHKVVFPEDDKPEGGAEITIPLRGGV